LKIYHFPLAKFELTNTKLLSKIKYEFLKAYLVLCPVNQPLMRLAENERSEVRSASRIILRAKLSRVNV
jgi:hypothetical protein